MDSGIAVDMTLAGHMELEDTLKHKYKFGFKVVYLCAEFGAKYHSFQNSNILPLEAKRFKFWDMSLTAKEKVQRVAGCGLGTQRMSSKY